jgi:hypothetical protein
VCFGRDEFHWTMSPQRPHSKSRERQSRSRFEVQLKGRKRCRTK